MILSKPQNQEELKKRQGGTARLMKLPQIQKSQYLGNYLEAQYFLKKVLKIEQAPNRDRIYLSRLQPVGDAPTKMDQKYTPPQHCIRFGIKMNGLQNLLKNQSQYYYAYHCIYNKANQLEILQSIIKNGFKIHPTAPNGKSYGRGTYLTPFFLTIMNYYAKKSILRLGNHNYQLILQVRVKKGTFTMHKNTALFNDDWPEDITEWLVKQPKTNNLIVWGIILRNVGIFK